MGMRKFWSVALPFGKVAYVVYFLTITYTTLLVLKSTVYTAVSATY